MAVYCDCNKTIYMEYIYKKLRIIKNILDERDIKHNSLNTVYPHTVHGTHDSQGKSHFISFLSKIVSIVRNFYIYYTKSLRISRLSGSH